MWIFSVVSAILSLVQGFQQAKAEKEMARRQEELGREAQGIAEANAQRIEAENREQARRLDLQQKSEEAKARAYAGASGFSTEDDTGSIALSLYAQKSENVKQLSYLKEAGASQAGIARQQGEYSLHSAEAQAAASRQRAKAAMWGGFAGAAKSVLSIGSISGGSKIPGNKSGSDIFYQPGDKVPVEDRSVYR